MPTRRVLRNHRTIGVNAPYGMTSTMCEDSKLTGNQVEISVTNEIGYLNNQDMISNCSSTGIVKMKSTRKHTTRKP